MVASAAMGFLFISVGSDVDSFISHALPSSSGQEERRARAWLDGHEVHGTSYRAAHSVDRSASADDAYDSEPTALLGWTVSALIHGSVLAAAALLTVHTSLIPPIPQKEPFRWDVSLMASPQDQPMIAQGVSPQEASAAAEPDLQTTVDARPSQTSQQRRQPEESSLTEAVAPRVVPTSAAHLAAPESGHSTVPAQHTAQAAAMAVSMPNTSILPPPDIESPRDSSHLQVEAQIETPPVLQRPSAITRSIVTRTTLPDYSWLMDVLRRRLERLKVYPLAAKAAHAQGRVLVQVRIQGDGHVLNPEIEESSGHAILDQAALEALRAASPLELDHVLEGESVVMLVPLNYQLE